MTYIPLLKITVLTSTLYNALYNVPCKHICQMRHRSKCKKVAFKKNYSAQILIKSLTCFLLLFTCHRRWYSFHFASTNTEFFVNNYLDFLSTFNMKNSIKKLNPFVHYLFQWWSLDLGKDLSTMLMGSVCKKLLCFNYYWGGGERLLY